MLAIGEPSMYPVPGTFVSPSRNASKSRFVRDGHVLIRLAEGSSRFNDAF